MRKVIQLDISKMVEAYQGGRNVVDLCNDFGISQSTVRKRLKAAGIIFKNRRQDLAEEVKTQYLLGASVKKLQGVFNVPRRVITKLLKSSGVVLRARRKGTSWRVKKREISLKRRILPRSLPYEDVSRQYKEGLSIRKLKDIYGCSATAIRNCLIFGGRQRRTLPQSQQLRLINFSVDSMRKMGEKRALTYQDKYNPESHHEKDLAEIFIRRGIEFSAQKAVGIYNCDFALGLIDVEIFGANGGFRMSGKGFERNIKRLRYFLDNGWDVLMILAERDTYPITENTSDRILAFLKECQNRGRNEPRIYRVIRGHDDVLISGSALDNPLRLVPNLRSLGR